LRWRNGPETAPLQPVDFRRQIDFNNVSGTRTGFTACLLEFLLRSIFGSLSLTRRAEILHRWSSYTLRAMNISILVNGSPPSSGLIVSNHLSYLDIMAFSTAAPCIFVSKREVRAWPGVGWIATLAASIYVDRSRRQETHAVQPAMQAALAEGLRLVLFPEGTSSDGARVLRFHSSLFQPAVDLQAQVFAASIAYTVPDGMPGTEVCYWGNMTLVPHMMNLLTKDSVTATVSFAPTGFRFNDRKAAAEQMHCEVVRLWAPTLVASP